MRKSTPLHIVLRDVSISAIPPILVFSILLDLLTSPIILLLLFIIALGVILAYWQLRKEWKINEERKIKALQIADIDRMQPLQFEHYVARLLIHQGYKARVTKATGDFGVDVVAEKDDQKYAVQVKRFGKPVSGKAIGEVVAGMNKYNCNEAMVVTNNYYTKAAVELARVNDCKLIDRDRLVEWIMAYQHSQSTNSDS